MQKAKKNNAYIDGANLHKGIGQLSWELDYGKLRVWLREKYDVVQAYIFLGFISKYKALYTRLQEQGYTLVFKDITYDSKGKVKGNCDADIVVKIMKDTYEEKFEHAVLVSSDGDYASLVSFLLEKDKIKAILSPALPQKCSILLKRTGVKIAYLDNQKGILSTKKEKPPMRTKPHKGLSRGDGSSVR
jgi:uncharacterized LabA/DUF88 family protein